MLLDDVAAAGYAGIDLGPVGYLGDASQLRERLEEHGLTLAGGFLELSFGEPEGSATRSRGSSCCSTRSSLPGRPSPDPDRLWLLAATSHAHFHLQRLSNAHGPPVSGERSRTGWRGRLGVPRAWIEPTFHHHVGPTSRRHNRSTVLEITDIDCALTPAICSSPVAIPLPP